MALTLTLPTPRLPTHYASPHWVRAHYPLAKSPFWQVRAYAAFFYARYCGKHGVSVNIAHKDIESLINREAISQIRLLSIDPKEEVRKLAREALEHCQDSPFLALTNVDAWLQTLDLTGDEIKEATEVLSKNHVSMSRLLSVTITDDDLRASLTGFSAGVRLALLSSLVSARKSIEDDVATSDNMARISSSMIGPLEGSSSSGDDDHHPRGITKQGTNPSLLHPEKPDIFLSYCWGNKVAAIRLKKFLDSQGLRVWMDEVQIKPGEQLFNQIDDGVSNCQVFLACLSPDYSRSINCRRELLLATERRKIIIPLHVAQLEEWPPRGDLGPLLAGKVYINVSSEEKFEEVQDQLVSAIKQSLDE